MTEIEEDPLEPVLCMCVKSMAIISSPLLFKLGTKIHGDHGSTDGWID